VTRGLVLAALLALLALLTRAGVAAAQPRVSLVDLGPGGSGRMLARTLAGPHRLVEPDSTWFVLGRGEEEPGSLVILGRTAAIEGSVRGDVVVVGGDLFIRPGARIAGRAAAIGGGAYPSTLATISLGVESFRDNTFLITRVSSGYQLAYQSRYEDASPPLTLPGIYGLRLPAYDRVDGVSFPFGPTLSFAGGRGEASALATYRSDLGKVDPSASAALRLTRRFRLAASGGRGTFSNEEWIWPTVLNSASALVFGSDTRNYYRADRGELTAHRLWETATLDLEPLVGARMERSWAVGPTLLERRGPWSIWGRTDTVEGMYRANPQVPRLNIASALGGVALKWQPRDVRVRARGLAEQSLGISGPGVVDPDAFTQVTTDVAVGFPTFGDQTYAMDMHWVTTPGGVAPPQRFAWLGGTGTMPFMELLEQGGGELLLVDQRYSIPLLMVRLGTFGSPTLQLRHRLGSAGLTRLPALDQMIGIGVHVALARAELQLDPATGRTRLAFGFAFSR
jgi:hypothetical protein